MVLVARPVASETTQLGVESLSAPGVPVAASRILQAMGFSLDPQADIAVFGPAGQLFDTQTVMNREWATGSVTGIPDYREVAFGNSGVFGQPVVTLVDTGVYDWVWTPRSIAGIDRPSTFSIEQGVAGLSAEKTSFAVMTAFNQSFSREGGADQGGSFFARRLDLTGQLSTNQKVTLTTSGSPASGNIKVTLAGQQTANIIYTASAATILAALEALSNVEPGDVTVTGGPLNTTPVVVETGGQFAQQTVVITVDSTGLSGGTSPAVTPTITTPHVLPTAEDIVPISPGEINLYFDDTSAAIGTTQYTGDFACGWAIGDRRNPVWTLNRSLNSFATKVETKPNPTFTASVNDDANGRALMSVMRSGASKFMRIECVGPPIGATAYNHEYVIDLHGKITGPPGRGNVNGARTFDWSFRTMYSSTWVKAMTIRLRTGLAVLA